MLSYLNTRNMKNRFFFFALLLLLYTASAAQNRLGVSYGAFVLHNNFPDKHSGSFYERTTRTGGSSAGAHFSLPINREARLVLGIGLTKLSYTREVQGIFPETNSFGLAVVEGTVDHWTFPISYSHYLPGRGTYVKGIKLSYVPSVAANSGMLVHKYGGAVQSDHMRTYTSDHHPFRHSLVLSLCTRFQPWSSLNLHIEPYAGIGTGYFKAGASAVKTLSYGINLSADIRFKLPRLYIEKQVVRDPNKDQKKKDLERKQKEIQEKLKNPK